MSDAKTTQIINEMATELWQLVASYLHPWDICSLAVCSKYLNDEVVWGRYSHALLWGETNLDARVYGGNWGNGTDENGEQPYTRTVLHQACRRNIPIKHLFILIKAGANVNVLAYFGETPLTFAIWNNHEDIIKLLLASGASPNICGDNASASLPLGDACRSGNVSIVLLLLDNKADINGTKNSGFTALMHACICEDEKIVKLLMDRGANTTLRTKWGDTALLIAERNYDDFYDDTILNMLHRN